MLAYADVCLRMLPYAAVCCRMLTYAEMRDFGGAIQSFDGTHFTCFTSTKVQILAIRSLQAALRINEVLASSYADVC